MTDISRAQHCWCGHLHDNGGACGMCEFLGRRCEEFVLCPDHPEPEMWRLEESP